MQRAGKRGAAHSGDIIAGDALVSVALTYAADGRCGFVAAVAERGFDERETMCGRKRDV